MGLELWSFNVLGSEFQSPKPQKIYIPTPWKVVWKFQGRGRGVDLKIQEL